MPCTCPCSVSGQRNGYPIRDAFIAPALMQTCNMRSATPSDCCLLALYCACPDPESDLTAKQALLGVLDKVVIAKETTPSAKVVAEQDTAQKWRTTTLPTLSEWCTGIDCRAKLKDPNYKARVST
ncbi:hypothetical protein NDU88_005522 [Pleurodeles waltl]|uniref:Uncharacterized protein n=1 Tax=Pleurodeles waltl TaxID=8319 RepID=A0AAV7TC94_PLEWA|nr:hypothetical protein NDU88_005522 [Pleurodeles waltl]